MKIAFNNLLSLNQNDSMSLHGIYPLITINSSVEVQKSKINGLQLLTYNNASVIIDNNNTFTINKNKIFNNSIVTIKADALYLSKIKNNIIKNNSFFNIYSNEQFSTLSSNYSGISKSNNNYSIINYDFVWSSNLAYNYNTNTLCWQPYNKNAVFVNDINRIQIKAENNKFSDEYSISLNFLYNKCLINGFYKSIIFNYYLLEREQKTISGFTLENNKNIFKFNIPLYYDIECSSLITIRNMHLASFDGLKLTSINCINSNLLLYNFNTNNVGLSALNSNILLDTEINRYDLNTLLSSSIINTNITINQLKLSYCLKYEDTIDYFPGYSILINPSGLLISSITKLFSSNTNGLITSLFLINLLLYDLINYSLIEIKQNSNKNVYLSGIYYNLKDNKITFVEGTYTLTIYKAMHLDKFFSYNTYPQFGNRIYSALTITNSKRNNNYMYGLESHTHKYYSNINSSYGKGTLYPIQSINSHQRLSNSNTKSLLSLKLMCSYYLPENSFLDSYISQRTILPIGSIINFYQVYYNNTWQPLIPRGYYRVMTGEHGINTLVDKTIVIDTDDPTSESFNGEFVKMFKQSIDGKLIIIPSYFKQPDNTSDILDITDTIQSTHRLIKIIKYAEKDEINEQ